MKKRIVAILLIFAAVASFSACKNITPGDIFPSLVPGGSTQKEYKGYYGVERESYDAQSPYYSGKSLGYGYNDLTSEDMKTCYNRIDESVYYISDDKDEDKGIYKTLKIELDGIKLTEAQLRVIISAYFGDNPQVFWIDNNFEYASTDQKTVLQLYSFLSGREVEVYLGTLSDKVESIVSSLPQGLDEYTRELMLHDALVDGCDYADGVESIEDDYKAFTSYGALVSNSAVCEGYSRGFQLLLSEVGIESYCVLGVGSEELHMWNCVLLGSDWYYTDTTWDEDDEASICYDYFNLTTEQIERDHLINPLYSEISDEEICGNSITPPKSFNIFVPDCDETEYNYFSQSAVVIDGIGLDNSEKLSNAIIAAAERAESEYACIPVAIDTYYLGYEYALDNLFYGGEYMVFDCIDDINSRGLGFTIDRNDVSIRRLEDFSAVYIYISIE
ncbi:MAG: hypothetical protein IJD19_04155 [Ruminococcus sp.]|nr:hypothetical protein [Ruminococcus sp.]